MRTGRIAPIIGQVALAGLLGLGVSVAGGQAAFADEFVWGSVPADSTISSDSPVTTDEFVWGFVAASATSTDEFVWG